MNTQRPTHRLFCLAAMLLAVPCAAGAQDIYKCVKAGQVAYTDRPCPGGKGELLHQADDSDILDRYLDLGQDDAAKRYADAHHLGALYRQRLEMRKQRQVARAQQQAEEAAANQRQREADQRQSEMDAVAASARLQGENSILRQQNAQYQAQLAQPVYDVVNPYYNAWPVYPGGIPPPPPGHGPGGKPLPPPPPPPPPVFHPCVPVAGGTVKC